jgi:hypothetical protein
MALQAKNIGSFVSIQEPASADLMAILGIDSALGERHRWGKKAHQRKG